MLPDTIVYNGISKCTGLFIMLDVTWQNFNISHKHMGVTRPRWFKYLVVGWHIARIIHQKYSAQIHVFTIVSLKFKFDILIHSKISIIVIMMMIIMIVLIRRRKKRRRICAVRQAMSSPSLTWLHSQEPILAVFAAFISEWTLAIWEKNPKAISVESGGIFNLISE